MEHIYIYPMILFIHLRKQAQAQHAGVHSIYLITLVSCPILSQ